MAAQSAVTYWLIGGLNRPNGMFEYACFAINYLAESSCVKFNMFTLEPLESPLSLSISDRFP
jgi:hypothetical protein